MKIKSLGGRGEPLLMIHGWGVNSEIWTSLVDELKLFVTVYVVDLPGMGGSSSISPYTLDNISKEIKANVPIKKCNILGWSLGGQVAMYLAIKMPEFVEKLILMSTTPCFVEKIDWPYGVNKQFFLNFEIEAKKNLNDTLMKFFLIQTRGINHSKKIPSKAKDIPHTKVFVSILARVISVLYNLQCTCTSQWACPTQSPHSLASCIS